MMVHGKRVISPAYRIYLYRFIHIDEDELRAFRELGVLPSEDSIERIEDLPGTAAFIEGDRA